MQKAQEELGAMEVTGESGGGMVKVTMNGRHEVRRVQIDPTVAAADREMLEDLSPPPSTTRPAASTRRCSSTWPARWAACSCRRA